MGEWSSDIANGDPEIEAMLRGVPGPMCPKIDAAKSVTRGGWVDRPTTRLARRNSFSSDESGVDDLYSVAAELESQRDRAYGALEECRTALEAMRNALVSAVGQYRDLRDDYEREVSP